MKPRFEKSLKEAREAHAKRPARRDTMNTTNQTAAVTHNIYRLVDADAGETELVGSCDTEALAVAEAQRLRRQDGCAYQVQSSDDGEVININGSQDERDAKAALIKLCKKIAEENEEA